MKEVCGMMGVPCWVKVANGLSESWCLSRCGRLEGPCQGPARHLHHATQGGSFVWERG